MSVCLRAGIRTWSLILTIYLSTFTLNIQILVLCFFFFLVAFFNIYLDHKPPVRGKLSGLCGTMGCGRRLTSYHCSSPYGKALDEYPVLHQNTPKIPNYLLLFTCLKHLVASTEDSSNHKLYPGALGTENTENVFPQEAVKENYP